MQADRKHLYSSMALKKYIEFVRDGKSYGNMKLADTQLLFLDIGQIYYDLDSTHFKSYRNEQVDYLTNLIENLEFINASKRILIHHIPILGGVSYYLNHPEEGHNYYFEIGGQILNDANIDIAINGHMHVVECVEKNRHRGTATRPWVEGYWNAYPAFVCDGPKGEKDALDTSYQNIAMTVLSKGGNTLSLESYTMRNDCNGGVKRTFYTVNDSIKEISSDIINGVSNGIINGVKR
jgi:hypothetical protein